MNSAKIMTGRVRSVSVQSAKVTSCSSAYETGSALQEFCMDLLNGVFGKQFHDHRRLFFSLKT